MVLGPKLTLVGVAPGKAFPSGAVGLLRRTVQPHQDHRPSSPLVGCSGRCRPRGISCFIPGTCISITFPNLDDSSCNYLLINCQSIDLMKIIHSIEFIIHKAEIFRTETSIDFFFHRSRFKRWAAAFRGTQPTQSTIWSRRRRPKTPQHRTY